MVPEALRTGNKNVHGQQNRLAAEPEIVRYESDALRFHQTKSKSKHHELTAKNRIFKR